MIQGKRDGHPAVDLPALVISFHDWLAEHRSELSAAASEPAGDLVDAVAAVAPVMRSLYEGGWTRLGWPESMGGLGGSPLQRATIYEELAAAGYVVPEAISTVEIIGPMLARYAPELASRDLPAALRGEEVWCQGFSEPDAGSDLGSLRTRAVPGDDGYVVSGQKMWSSLGHVARRCSLLARTGETDSGYRGLTMFWVDLETPGITVVPTACSSGRSETAEIFFDSVFVPSSNIVGKVGAGWEAVMYLMQFERGAYAWLRQGEMLTDLSGLLGRATDVPGGVELVADTYLSLFALRSLAKGTLHRLVTGENLGPEISVDKIVLATTEQLLTDTARQVLWPALDLDDRDEAIDWRRKWAYSRITTVYGGAIEVQRDLVAERLLALPRGR